MKNTKNYEFQFMGENRLVSPTRVYRRILVFRLLLFPSIGRSAGNGDYSLGSVKVSCHDAL